MSKKPRRIDKQTTMYYVEKINAHRGKPGHYEYLTSWYGYDSSFDSWEPQSSFQDDAAIQAYWKRIKPSA